MVQSADISLPRLMIRSSYRCVWCGFDPHTGHMCDKSSSVCGCVKWFFPGFSLHILIKKVQVGKDQEKAQSEKDSHSKNRGGKKTN